MLTSYRRILGLPGTLLFSATGMVARLPMSMVSLGIVLLVSTATGSYGLAGSVSAAYLIANGGFAIAQGRLLDRLGQSRVLPVAVAIFGAALALLMWSVQAGWPVAVSYLLAAVSGAALPSVGACVRARWSHVLRSPDQLQTAFALEAVVDESVFMLGPILVTVLATAWHPVAGLTAALVSGVVGTLFFAAQRATEPPAHPRREATGPRPGMPWATVAPLALVCAALGTLFGAAEVTTVAFAEELGSKGYAGPLLALWALGSLIAGLVTGAVHWRRGPDHRLRWGSAAMMAAMLPLALIGSVAADGGRAVRRRVRHRAHPDRDDVAHREDGPARPAHRGDGDHAHRHRGRRRSRSNRRGRGDRRVRRVPGLPRRRGRRPGLGPGRPGDPPLAVGRAGRDHGH